MIRTLSGWITANKVNKWKGTGGTLFKAFTFDYAKDFDKVKQRPLDIQLYCNFAGQGCYRETIYSVSELRRTKNMGMNYREKAFRTKFMNAGRHLGVAPDRVISLKLRDMVSSYNDYHEMLLLLEHETGIQSIPIKDDLQGRGYLVGQGDQKIIVVEHETGLEILYVTGSIASLIGLIPLVLQAWGAIRGHLDRSHANHIRGIEIRRIDAAGNLREDHQHDLPISSSFPLNILNSTIFSAARVLENDLKSLTDEVRSHSERLDTLEKGLNVTRGVKSKKQTKKTSNKTLKKGAAKSRRAS